MSGAIRGTKRMTTCIVSESDVDSDEEDEIYSESEENSLGTIQCCDSEEESLPVAKKLCQIPSPPCLLLTNRNLEKHNQYFPPIHTPYTRFMEVFKNFNSCNSETEEPSNFKTQVNITDNEITIKRRKNDASPMNFFEVTNQRSISPQQQEVC
mmetsp:Transcript_11661/g.14066  ORF Transcript_11661/g.14066 Transcript_11661/m.14066 type:complete len:153 (+) Transcript_11661:211-669(+)